MKRLLLIFVLGLFCTLIPLAEEIPDFELNTLTGNNKVSFHRYLQGNKATIVNFFTTWCPYCRKELKKFTEYYSDRAKGVEFLAISVGEELAKVVEFRDKLDIPFPIVLGTKKIADYFKIRSIPVTVVFDKDMNVIKKYIGARSIEAYIELLDPLLGSTGQY